MIKKIRNYNAGMTYVELIVVLSIFSVMTSVVLFNYNEFQAKIDIKVLANDIALKIVEAQKSALSGKLPQICIDAPGDCVDWKPSYGIYFDLADNARFIYFANFDNNFYDSSPTDSILDRSFITKNNIISGLEVVGVNCSTVTNLNIVFRRPDSKAIILDSSGGALCDNTEYVKITVSSPELINATIEVYSSGRIQIN
ncbi:MAG: hypothetical protein UR62_C0011G0007 [Candidatus Nomurabacteria bacterium GW2011_GWF2_35_12]|uniref:Prepilin-type N-terminal cleavage/methylation domain-containing protein n=3 Tax=Candidatus Nomuraibacteriota TaxID=1752729 RepID=A0A0G0ECA0_9BACT|nr:MAG: hypothetical protein UR62_C0011G0007 [Candidatus Nomurabacteria bacterium GW2011_GWF2_35_12]KKP72555.1 MAG: hypothetical protein UR70_C0006G0006 [Candidatus Nomurabacteria bacterium GW2011_GWB1_35_20]KKP76584.1 MAG: hypothetical protein UR72_C0001G0029 [Parcubacteria group bacterium GW2011_GWC1_35_21]KKP78451.1 MAG: hypothetical protein UR77_C0002G0003 [Candidatus Nomurabacteria bacterium GW2011_GWC2_35_35]KKP84181.1 MAG: hypothetical protein UR86_C0034G0007 [Parcubacteria group bacteri